jgi:hypothetical protein
MLWQGFSNCRSQATPRGRTWGSHRNVYKKFYLLEHNAVQSTESQLSQRNMSPPSSGLKSKPGKKTAKLCLLPASCWCLAWLTCEPRQWKQHVPLRCQLTFNGLQDFSLPHSIQTGSGAHPASYPRGVRGPFPGGKATGAWSWPLTST